MADEKPGAFTTIQAVSTSATALVVGAAVGSTTPTANSGMAAATITLLNAIAPTITTNKIYNISGALYFNGLSLATGGTISGTVGTVPKFTGATALGDSNITISGSTATVTGTVVATTNFSGPGALLTGIPTSAVSSGNFVATVASGTGITSSATSGNAAATTITLNNTAVTPSTYGSSTAVSVFTVDQQGRITSATTATPQLTLTSTYFSSLAATNLTGSSGITGLGTVTSGVWNAGAITSSGLATFNGAGTHTFSNNSNAMLIIQLSNTTSGTSGQVGAYYTAGTVNAYLETFSEGYTTSGTAMASSTRLLADSSNGMSFVATHASGPIRFYSGGSTERGRFSSGGRFLLGRTTTTGSDGLIGVSFSGALVVGAEWVETADQSAATFLSFAKSDGTQIGSVRRVTTTDAVQFNTTSDYRTKDIDGLMSDEEVLTILRGFKIYKGRRKGSDYDEPMLLAHEAQKPAPWAITGEHDKVENGRPVYQQRSVGALEDMLIAACQAMDTRCLAIEAKVGL